MKILSITLDANSSACAMEDGHLLAAISEERFNKIKKILEIEYNIDTNDRFLKVNTHVEYIKSLLGREEFTHLLGDAS